MKRLAKILPLVLLPMFLSLWGAAGCGSAPPTVLLNIMGAAEMVARIDAAIANNGRSASVSFYRDTNNNYSTTSAGMPPMMPSPANIQLAFDLPASTTGAVRITLSFQGAASQQMPMMGVPPLQVLQVGCATADVSAGGLVTIPVTPMAAPATCP
ncbi:MAG: hypothetical protein U1A78_16885 [Polyangia bacterium]